eukprot:TRINITY_DN40541_c0_g1_i1.p1 TRINITY_DN40541_c0_g1~~TRINITY_DN40541_c0_g1_i1.p1  ORF type:complete len:262 (+),score=24.73 TRINITY_DN40541_c0_g1_i1:113-898(+)
MAAIGFSPHSVVNTQKQACSVVIPHKVHHALSSSLSLQSAYRGVTNVRVKHRISLRSAKVNISTVKAGLSEEPLMIEERDWSFLERSCRNLNWKIKRVVEAGKVEKSSKVVVAMGTLQFVEYLVSKEPSAVSVYHYSLLQLADIKEKHDSIRCKQGDITNISSSWPSLDVVFINYLSALKHPLPNVLQAVIPRCSPGARLVVSDIQGRNQLMENKTRNPDIIIGDLPDQLEMETFLQRHNLHLMSFSDEPDFYLAELMSMS